MKPHLTSVLLTLIAISCTTFSASADVVGNGVCYDIGKAYYSSDPNIESKKDKEFCWVAGGANIIQYWQDTYKAHKDEGVTNLPDGIDNTYSSPVGSMYLEVYQKAYESGIENEHGNFYQGYPRSFVEWWIKGTHTEELQDKTGYYTDWFSKQTSAASTFHVTYQQVDKPDAICFGDPETFRGTVEKKLDGNPGNNVERWGEMSSFIKEAFEVQGRALALEISSAHIITCWGYETNADGLVTSLLLSDSDDAQFGTFRAQIYIGDTDAYEMWEGFSYSYGQRLMITTDDQSALKYPIGYGREEHGAVWLTAFTYVDTPVVAEKIAPDAMLPSGEAITSNVRLTADQKVEGSGIAVGDGTQAVVLTSASDISVTLDGKQVNQAGLTVAEGAMASLSNVEISNYAKSGVESIGKTYCHDGVISIHDNSTGENGGAVNNSNYLEFLDCSEVTISDNNATGQGGAISNTDGGTVSIRGNKEVVFSGNQANGGANDIYNGADSFLNIADNDSVTFNGTGGEAAIVNDGKLYLRAEDGKKITFNNASLNSDKGETYIGKDIMFRDNNIEYYYVYDTNENNGGKVEFINGGSYTSLQANLDQELTYASLEKLSVSADSILGAGDGSGVVSNALITSLGGLAVGNLKLDTTDSLVSQGPDYIHLDKVVLTLTSDDMVDNTFDLTGVFSGNLTFNAVEFDLSKTTIDGDALRSLTFDLSKAYAEEQKRDISFKTATGTYKLAQAGSTVLFASAPIPEPTTGTLSLLALAGLAFRRRRK